MGKAIEVDHLVKRFSKPRGYWKMLRHPRTRPKTEALRGITFSVQQGEVFGLLGPNGAGKTTLIKILCTLVLPTDGSAQVMGRDVVRNPAAVRSSIGYVVADERSFYWRLTGRQNLRFFATMSNLVGKEAQRRVDELVDMVGLEQEVDRPFLHYSSGTRQKMAVARGLLTNPPVLLLDEPTRSLDLPTARAVRDFVKTRLAAQGRAVLIATHNMEEAAELCNRVAVIDQGKLKAWGTPTEIARSVDWTGRRLVLEVEGWTEDAMRRVRLLSPVQHVRPETLGPGEGGRGTRLEIELGDGRSAVGDVIETVVLSGCRITFVHEETPSLTELFLHLTGESARSPESPRLEDPLLVEP